MQLGGSVVDVSLRQNLDIVDKFIADCEQRVKEEPQDDLAREYLTWRLPAKGGIAVRDDGTRGERKLK